MIIKIFPCQGRCNVSMMTKTVAQIYDDFENISVLPNLGLLLDENVNKEEEKWIALNGCPAKCSSKEFETYRLEADAEIVITKGYGPENSEKYEVLLNIDEEVSMVQEVIDRLEDDK